MKIIAMTNKKGGVGKTTTALSTAACLGQHGFSVLAIDMDQPGSAMKAELDVSDLRSFQVKGMLYQTGYLTIAGFNGTDYALRIPDEEVRRDLCTLLAGVAAAVK